jgi:hypothetical protein
LIYSGGEDKWCGPIGNWNNPVKGKKGCFNGGNCKIDDHKKRAKLIDPPVPGGYINLGVNRALMEPRIEWEIVKENQRLLDWLNEQKMDHALRLAVVEALNRHHVEGSTSQVILEDVMGLVEVIESNTEDVIAGGNNKSPMPLIKSLKSDLDSFDSEMARDQDALAKNVKSVAEEQELFKAMMRTTSALVGSPSDIGGPLFQEVERLTKAIEARVDREEEMDKALGTLRRDLERATSGLSDVESGQTELHELMNTLLDSLDKLDKRKGSNVPQSVGVGVEEFNEVKTQLEEVRNQVNNPENYLIGEVNDEVGELLSLGKGVHEFWESDIVRLNRNVKGKFPIWYDPLAVLSRISKGVLDIESLQKTEIHEAKTGKAYEVSLYETAWRSIYPGVFFRVSTKSGDQADNSTRPDFTAIRTYKLFNRKDGNKGIGTILRKNLKDTEPKLMKEIKLHLGNDKEAIAVATYLLRQSCEYISALLTFMDCQYDQLLVNCHGDPPHTVKAQQEVWDLVLLLVTVMFETLWSTRSEAETAYQDPDTAQITYLRTAIKTHIEMEKFVDKDFVEHQNILPKLFRHIFESFVSRSDFDKVKEDTERLSLEVNALTKAIDTFNTKLADAGVNSGVPRLSANQRKKLRQKEAAAAAKSGEDSD